MKISERAEQIYRKIAEDISGLPGEQRSNPNNLLVTLGAGDVTINGFWARVYEDCAAGIQYRIENAQGTLLKGGEIPLHKVPWKYQQSKEESSQIMDRVARALVTNFARARFDRVSIEGRDNISLYSGISQEGLQVWVNQPILPAFG